VKVRIDKLDVLFSRYIRLRDRVCQRCGNGNTVLQAAHFISRAEKSIRYDEDNVCSLCMGCHSYLDGRPLEKVQFFEQRLGQPAYDYLLARRRNRVKPDRAAIQIYLKAKIRELENVPVE
jgi:5-methylcytosine-specific restriction endonuclease McrA